MTAHAASTSAQTPFSLKDGTVAAAFRGRRPARRVLAAAVLALMLPPVHLGEAVAATSDAAAYLTQIKPTKATKVDPRAYVQARASRSGWRGQQWRCLSAILYMESRFQPTANNGTHYGLFQEHNLRPGTDLATQTRRGLRYVAERYGTPCHALSFHLEHGWF